MKIAITADVHLRARKNYPERYKALENILDQMLKDKIDTLIISGDLFDAESQNYAEFDEICNEEKYKSIKFYIIPGNHDSQLSAAHITANNVEVISEPKIIPFDKPDCKFFFLPFLKEKTTMGEELAKQTDLDHDRWVLIAHGDYMTGIREPNPHEPGIYMPLTRKDIENYKPAKVILGHIHKQMDQPIVHYVGSPCSLDINETGRRRFLILDTNNLSITPKIVDTDFLYFNESIVVLPIEDEVGYIKTRIDEMVKRWKIDDSQTTKVRIRVKFRGYSSNPRLFKQTIEKSLAKYTFYENEGPDISEVSSFDDPERIEIVNQVNEKINGMDWESGEDKPAKDDILIEALHTILKE